MLTDPDCTRVLQGQLCALPQTRGIQGIPPGAVLDAAKFFPGYDALNAKLETPGTALVPLLELCQVTATYFYSKLEFGLTKYFQALL